MDRPTRTNIFLTTEDRQHIEAIKGAHGLETASSAVRLALREIARQIERRARWRRAARHDRPEGE